MGFFRLILAFSVVMAHGSDMLGKEWAFHPLHSFVRLWSCPAVFAFFILSGFTISMVITEKYQHMQNGMRQFYLNRMLRIYPLHLAVLVLLAALYIIAQRPYFLLGDYEGSTFKLAYALLTNILLLGVEWLPLVDEKNVSIVAGPIWSLGLELCFYLIAPFVVGRSTRSLIAMTLIFGVLRYVMVVLGECSWAWRYYFFPADLVFFLMGCCAYRFYVFLRGRAYRQWMGGVAASILGVCVISPPLETASKQAARRFTYG